MDKDREALHEELLERPEAELLRGRANRVERHAAVVRIGLVVIGVPLIVIFEGERAVEILTLLGILVAFSGIAVLIARRYPDSVLASSASWPVALGVSLGVVAITGGGRSPYWFFVVLPMIGAAARFGRRLAAVAMALVVVGSGAVLLATPGLPAYRIVMPLFALIAAAVGIYLFGAHELETQRSAVLDPVTELFNRRHLIGRMAEMDVNLARGAGVAVVVMDLDRFKRVNDRHGHDRGDATLRDVAYILRANIREGDAAFRAGGEEFVVILPGADGEIACGVAERIRSAIEGHSPSLLGVTASFGVASATPSDGIDMAGLVRSADSALFVAKRQGRNRVCASGDVSSDLVGSRPGALRRGR